MAVILGYWDLRGICEPIRYMLSYLNIEYEEKRYKFGPPPDYSRDDWIKDKTKLNLDFPNLPFYIDEDVILTQSKAIMRYLGRKHQLMGQTENEMIRIDIIENFIEDFRNGLRYVVYGPHVNKNLKYEDLREEYLKTMDQPLKQISDFLGDNQWIAGHRLTYVDFWAYDIIDWHRLFHPKCLTAYENIREYMNRFENLPHVKEYLSSDRFKRFPIFAPYAKFGGETLK